ncbi:MAG: hypothetical protein KME57_34605 [Scytonema hyalinum WJT4-NPBG1]|jgi:hypothetical protein|nr:hypothetical protein [Scytonema hyalinum WJT4-NPBG1]
MNQLSIYDIEKLEIARKLLEEVEASEGFKATDYHPDLHLGDALQAIDELLSEYYPENYTPLLKNEHPDLCIELTYPFQKLKTNIFTTLSEISGVLVITAALSACTSLFCWGVSDAKDAFGYRSTPDFAAQSQAYRGLALASVAAALGCGVVGSVIKGDK